MPGYVNVDLYAPEADVRGDIRELSFGDVDEVLMEHVLEHISFRDELDVMRRVHGWMRPGGELTVEVPDMNLVTREAMKNPDWVRYLYGSQEHEGEVHRNGFTLQSVSWLLEAAGFRVVESQLFRSDDEHRLGMPVIRVVTVAR
jgi:predicted SAM-dependent methyltransferase